MKLKNYKVNKCFYSGRQGVSINLPEGLTFARVYPSGAHYEGQKDMISIFECSEEDENILTKNNSYIHTYRLDKYVIITITAIDDNEDIPRCELEELNNKYDLSKYFIVEFDHEYRILYIAKVKGFIDTSNILTDVVEINVMFSNQKAQNININTNLPIDRLGGYVSLRQTRVLSGDKPKKIFYTQDILYTYIKISQRNRYRMEK